MTNPVVASEALTVITAHGKKIRSKLKSIKSDITTNVAQLTAPSHLVTPVLLKERKVRLQLFQDLIKTSASDKNALARIKQELNIMLDMHEAQSIESNQLALSLRYESKVKQILMANMSGEDSQSPGPTPRDDAIVNDDEPSSPKKQKTTSSSFFGFSSPI